MKCILQFHRWRPVANDEGQQYKATPRRSISWCGPLPLCIRTTEVSSP